VPMRSRTRSSPTLPWWKRLRTLRVCSLVPSWLAAAALPKMQWQWLISYAIKGRNGYIFMTIYKIRGLAPRAKLRECKSRPGAGAGPRVVGGAARSVTLIVIEDDGP